MRRAAAGGFGRTSGAPARGLRGGRWLAPGLLGLLLGALLLAALRNDLLRLRYALGETWKAEVALAEEQRALTAELRRLRDPARLARRAPELALASPERLVDLSASLATAPPPPGAENEERP